MNCPLLGCRKINNIVWTAATHPASSSGVGESGTEVPATAGPVAKLLPWDTDISDIVAATRNIDETLCYRGDLEWKFLPRQITTGGHFSPVGQWHPLILWSQLAKHHKLRPDCGAGRDEGLGVLPVVPGARAARAPGPGESQRSAQLNGGGGDGVPAAASPQTLGDPPNSWGWAGTGTRPRFSVSVGYFKPGLGWAGSGTLAGGG